MAKNKLRTSEDVYHRLTWDDQSVAKSVAFHASLAESSQLSQFVTATFAYSSKFAEFWQDVDECSGICQLLTRAEVWSNLSKRSLRNFE